MSSLRAHQPQPKPLWPRTAELLPYAAIVTATLLAYLPALGAGFIWNDSDYVTAPALRSLGGLGRIWFELGATEQYYPLLHSAFWLEHRLWGDSAFCYHLLNVLLHAASCALLYRLLRLLSLPGALLAAMVFAVHPVCVESVAWVSEQKNTLSTALYLAAALAYLRFAEKRAWHRYAIASALFIMAILAKSVTASLPAALLVLAWWRKGSLSPRQDLYPLAPWLGFGATMGLLSGWVERHFIGADGTAFALSLTERTLVSGRAILFYLGKLLWPSDLIFFYPRWTPSATDPSWYVYPAVVLCALGACVWATRFTRAPLAGALVYVGTLFPTLGFFNIYAFIFSYVADHWQYLACLGIIVPGCAALARTSRPWPLQLRAGLFLLLVGSLGAITWNQSGMYRSMETFYRTTLAKNPAAWMAHNNLGVYLRENKRPGAEAEYRAALAIKPDYIPAHFNLGVELLDAHRAAEAVTEFTAALGSRHKDPVHLYLGDALMETGRYPEAAEHYLTHIRLDPEASAAWLGLARALARSGRPTEAIGTLSAAARRLPNATELSFALGDFSAQAGDYQGAIAAYRHGLDLDPNRVDVMNNLGNALALSGNPSAAVDVFREALKRRPGTEALQRGLQWALQLQAEGLRTRP